MLAQLNDCIGVLLHLGPNVITFRAFLHLGPNVITFRTLLHLGLQQTLFRIRKQSVFLTSSFIIAVHKKTGLNKRSH